MAKWIEKFETTDSRKPRLFCFPFAGGNSTAFRPLAKLAASEYEICAVELPGRLGRLEDRPIGEIHELVGAIYSAIKSELIARPTVFLGYSFGSLIAFELARLLKKNHGNCPKGFVVLSREAPESKSSQQPLHKLPMREFLLGLEKRYGFVQKMLLESEELQKMVEPAMRADFSVFENYNYAPGEVLNCPITVIAGTDDKSVQLTNLENWRNETSASFELKRITAGHFLLAGNERLVAEVLKAAAPKTV